MHPGRRAVWLNALALRPGGSGVQTYIRELVRELSHHDDLRLVAAVQADAVGELPTGVSAVARPTSAGARRALHGLRRARDVDLVHGLDVDLPWRSEVPTVATVHDLSVFDVPWAHSRARGAAERALLRRTARHGDLLISVSEFTAERLMALTGRSSVVTPLAPGSWTRVPDAHETFEVRARYGLPDRFVLQVASLEPRKSASLLVESGRLAGLPVVLAGAGTATQSRPGSVQGLGYVDRADLPALYGAATVVAYLSSYEGFGLPPLEAMACGATVVASGTGPIPEVLGDGAVLVGTGSEDIAAVLARLAGDDEERAALAAAGRRQAATYTWARTAALTAAVYDRAWTLP